GKKVGLVGFGAVAQAAAKILDGFDCEVCYYDYKGRPFGHYTPMSVEEIFKTCDIVSLHLPVSDSTRGLVNEKLLRSMKPDALFVNAGRSALVDTKALIRVLNDKAIAGAVIDVLDNEPPTPEDLEIMNCPNTILTPHICGASYEVTNHQADILNARLKKWLAGEDLARIVYNRDVLK
ncbi:MAG: 3-phosphoglycerate dehydrogenase, partial [Oscillospiraceae bacterium]|nr:3-phosphoglycerate dehydrogenase [Oscillospiraceae bacterium]